MIETVRNSAQIVVEQVGVDLERHGRGRVPEYPLHGLHVRAGLDREARCGVPEVVRREAFEANSGRRTPESTLARFRAVHVRTAFTDEEQVERTLARADLLDHQRGWIEVFQHTRLLLNGRGAGGGGVGRGLPLSLLAVKARSAIRETPRSTTRRAAGERRSARNKGAHRPRADLVGGARSAAACTQQRRPYDAAGFTTKQRTPARTWEQPAGPPAAR